MADRNNPIPGHAEPLPPGRWSAVAFHPVLEVRRRAGTYDTEQAAEEAARRYYFENLPQGRSSASDDRMPTLADFGALVLPKLTSRETSNGPRSTSMCAPSRRWSKSAPASPHGDWIR